MLGARVPVELRIFLTAAAIVDDIVAIVVVAIFYSGRCTRAPCSARSRRSVLLVVLNRSGVYRVTPYVITGVVLWVCVHAGGLHADTRRCAAGRADSDAAAALTTAR